MKLLLKWKRIQKSLQYLFVILSLFSLSTYQEEAYAIIHSGLDVGKKKLSTPAQLLRNWGLDNSYASHINVRKAWQITKGSKEVIVAVIDTGIDPNQPDLKDNLWKKPGSIVTKFVNGKKVESFEYGWDFVKNEKNPTDVHGHGTHVAGIIGATAAANAGASGVAPKVSIMAIRYYSATASGAENLANTVKAIHYAIENGAHIINYSGGGAEFSSSEKKAIELAQKKGILFVAAAGNEHKDTNKESNKYYPGAYNLSNIISVAATDINNNLLNSSNWGSNTIHVTAPGENIFSTMPNGKYGYLTGTSQATAFVTGEAALLMAKNPALKWSPEKVKDIIVTNVDKIAELKDKVISGGRINAYAALQSITNKITNGISLVKNSEDNKNLNNDWDTEILPAQDWNTEKRVPAKNTK